MKLTTTMALSLTPVTKVSEGEPRAKEFTQGPLTPTHARLTPLGCSHTHPQALQVSTSLSKHTEPQKDL